MPPNPAGSAGFRPQPPARRRRHFLAVGRRLARERCANLGAGEHLRERLLERGALDEALRELLQLVPAPPRSVVRLLWSVEEPGRDPLDDVVLGERSPERLRQRPCKKRVECPFVGEPLELHEALSSARRILGDIAQSR